MIESMDRLALIQGQKIVETTVSFLSKRTIESMNSLAVIHGQKIVERKLMASKNGKKIVDTTVRV